MGKRNSFETFAKWAVIQIIENEMFRANES